MKSGLDESILADIACHSNVNIEDVRHAYQSIIDDLHKKSRIHDFIPLLAMNRVREYFRPTSEQKLNHPVANICIDIGHEKSLNPLEYFSGRYAQS